MSSFLSRILLEQTALVSLNTITFSLKLSHVQCLLQGTAQWYQLFDCVVLSLLTLMFSHRMQKCPEALCYILDQLSNIWTQPEWKANLINSFCNCRFRTTFLNVLVFFEKELGMCLKGNSSEIDQESSISYATLTKLLQLILPTLLMVKTI